VVLEADLPRKKGPEEILLPAEVLDTVHPAPLERRPGLRDERRRGQGRLDLPAAGLPALLDDRARQIDDPPMSSSVSVGRPIMK